MARISVHIGPTDATVLDAPPAQQTDTGQPQETPTLPRGTRARGQGGRS